MPQTTQERGHDAAESHNSAAADVLLLLLQQAGLDATATGNSGRNALHTAARYNQDARVVRILFELPGIDVIEVDSEGRTALYYAAAYNCKEVVAVLLDQAVDVNAPCGQVGPLCLADCS